MILMVYGGGSRVEVSRMMGEVVVGLEIVLEVSLVEDVRSLES